MIYLDHNATTPVHPEVLKAMQPYWEVCGNASSLHRFGRMHSDAIAQAREQVAALVGARAEQVVFTSGGTEANNLLLKGFAAAVSNARIAVSKIEHMSLLQPAQVVSVAGTQVDWINCDEWGHVTPEDLQRSLHADTRLVSVMMANNETGVIQDVSSLAAITRSHDAFIHTDASQAAGKMPLSFSDMGVHAMTVSAHKFNGPPGVGALIMDSSLPLQPILHGGSQEKGFRAGTENVAAIAGFGKAAEIAKNELESRMQHTRSLRDALETELSALAKVKIFAEHSERLSNTVQFGVAGFDGETLLMQLDRKGIAVSSGSACTSGKTEASHVLKAMQVPNDYALGAIRISFGTNNTRADVDALIKALVDIMPMKNSAVMLAANL